MVSEIRRAKLEEIYEINKLVCGAFGASEAFDVDINFLKSEGIHCYVAVSGSKIIGTATLHIVQKTNRKMGLIEDVVVRPEIQRKGIGKKMVQKLIEHGKNLNLYKIILNTKEKNIPFYEQMDFKIEQIQMVIRN